MKWLFLVVSIFIKQFSNHPHAEIGNPVEEIKDFIKENAFKVVMGFTVASALGSVFVAGLVMTIVNLSTQYDQTMSVRFTAMIVSGLAFMLISIAATSLLYYNAINSVVVKKIKVPLSNINTNHPLQDAFAVLVMDFVKEREFRRNNPETEKTAFAAGEKMHAPTDGTFSEVDKH